MNNGGKMFNKVNDDLTSAFKMIKQLASMIGTNAQNLLKLGKVVQTNTDNMNLLATRVLKLEQRIKELESNETT